MISNHFLCKDLVHHPIETTIYNWLFGVPGMYFFVATTFVTLNRFGIIPPILSNSHWLLFYQKNNTIPPKKNKHPACWWLQPSWKIVQRWESSPKVRGENEKQKIELPPVQPFSVFLGSKGLFRGTMVAAPVSIPKFDNWSKVHLTSGTWPMSFIEKNPVGFAEVVSSIRFWS